MRGGAAAEPEPFFPLPLLLALFLVLLLPLGGCSRRVTAPGEPLGIHFIPSGREEFDTGILEGLNTASAGKNIEVTVVGTGEGDAEAEQLSAARAFIESDDADALILVSSSDAVTAFLAESGATGGRPVVLIGRSYPPEEGFPPGFMLVGADRELGGRIAAGYLAAELDTAGDLYASSSFPEDPDLEAGIRGFYAGISGHPGMRMVGIDYAFGSAEKSFFQTLSIFQVHPGISGIFAAGEAEATGVFRFLSETGMLGTIRFISWGWNSELLDAMRRGYLDAVVYEDSSEMGSETVLALHRFFREEGPLPARISTGVRMVDDWRELVK